MGKGCCMEGKACPSLSLTCSTFLLKAVMLLSQSNGDLPLLYTEYIRTPREYMSLDTSHDLDRMDSGAA